MSGSPPFAFVTLVTTDHYLPGALVVAAALRDIHLSPPASAEELDPSEFHTVCLVTPESVDVSTVKLLRKAFDVVIGVELIEEETEEGLKLLGRPDLKTVLTKLHIFRLTSYRKIIFLDADVLPLRPLSHLFRISADFAAVPDVGWPDIFNSGFLVLEPSAKRFDEVRSLVQSKGSWDGGDQGVLNEWRGNDWERLSFTYNTTPTAAYTYAPAYKRFGSQISNIHFIGPNKPWSHISSRPPGVSSSDSNISVRPSQNFAPPPSYAYPALLDRWFAVYDKHYRTPAAAAAFKDAVAQSAFTAAETTTSKGEFVAQRYESVWDSDMRSDIGAEVSTSGAPLGLDELRRLAVEGVGSSGAAEGEGVYRSLPLEGRVDLMRPQKFTPQLSAEKPTPVVRIQLPEEPQTPTRSPAPMTTLPTPGPNEFPPAPMFRGHSLPPETPTHSPHLQSHVHTASPLRTVSPSQPTIHRHSSPPHDTRPASPPLLSWNPAVEAPPNAPPPESHFPEQTYFPNVWDAPTQDYHHPPEESGGFFPVPPPSSIPEQLIREGHYRAVIGEPRQDEQQHQQSQQETHVDHQQQQHDAHQEHHHSPQPSHPQPDRSKIMTVFPWEENPRHAPERFFPPSDSPPPGHPFIQPQPPALKLDLHPPRTSPSQPPVHGFPRTTTYANAWDAVPSIQRYASRLVRPAPVSAPLVSPWTTGTVARTRKGSGATAGGDEYRSWQDRAEVSSRDADDEDEGDDDEHSPPSVGAESDRSDGVGEPLSKKIYKMKGVQTITKEMKHQGVQVQNGRPPARSASSNVPVGQVYDTGKDHGSTSMSTSGRSLPQDMKIFERMADASPAVDAPGFMLPSGAQPLEKTQRSSSEEDQQGPSGALSPRLHDAYAFGSVIHPGLGTASQEGNSPMPELSPPVPESRIAPSEVASVPGYIESPPSSLGPSSPPEEIPVLQGSQSATTVRRPARRTFDPARGVDVFKRGSEEVLARFLKMGSWEDDSLQGPGSPSVA